MSMEKAKDPNVSNTLAAAIEKRSNLRQELRLLSATIRKLRQPHRVYKPGSRRASWAAQKLWREKNAAKLKAQRLAWRAKNADRVNSERRERYYLDPEYRAKTRARQHAAYWKWKIKKIINEVEAEEIGANENEEVTD
jgi:hypothetical protein